MPAPGVGVGVGAVSEGNPDNAFGLQPTIGAVTTQSVDAASAADTIVFFKEDSLQWIPILCAYTSYRHTD